MNRSGFVPSILGGMFMILLSGSPAKASTVIPPTTCQAQNPYMINQSGDYVLNSDITCNDSTAIIVNADNVTIRLKGFSIRCWAPPITVPHGDVTYKNSCQGSFYTGSDLGQHIKDCGVWTNGHSNVKIQGPGMIQGFGVGILLDGSGMQTCGAMTAASPAASAFNVKAQMINVTGPDGRSDISDPIAGPRPRSFGIIAVNFLENAGTCSKWDSDDDHTHGNEIFGSSVDNYTEGIALYNASRVDVHENFVHDNNDAGDSAVSSPVCTTVLGITTCVITPVTTYESHGILVCANDTSNPNRASACTPGMSFRNKIRNNLIVDNGQNSCIGSGCSTNNNTPGPENDSTEQIDGGLSLIGVANKNDVTNNTVIGNNGDGISLRNGADMNRISSNSSLMNTSTDAPYTATGQPTMPHFWDITFRGAGANGMGGNNIINSNNRCLTQTSDVP